MCIIYISKDLGHGENFDRIMYNDYKSKFCEILVIDLTQLLRRIVGIIVKVQLFCKAR